MIMSSGGVPPESFPDANLPLEYFWKIIDTPIGLWAIRLVFILCIVAMVLGYRHYNKRNLDIGSEKDGEGND